LSGFIHLYMIVVWRMTAISYAIDQQGHSHYQRHYTSIDLAAVKCGKPSFNITAYRAQS